MNCIISLPFPKEYENDDHSTGWEIDKLIHHKLYENVQYQIGENPLSVFCFFVFFPNTLPIPREDHGKLPKSYKSKICNDWALG